MICNTRYCMQYILLTHHVFLVFQVLTYKYICFIVAFLQS